MGRKRFTVRAARLKHRPPLTQQALAALSGIDQSTISDIERGDCDPRNSTVEALLEALGLPPGSLVFGPSRQVSV